MYRCHLFIILLVSFIDFNYATNYTCDPTSSCGCSTALIDITARIVGGELAPDGAWGWAVSLQVYGAHKCTAVLITAEYALTAAHCVYGVTTPSIFSIVAGTNYVYDTSATVQHRPILDMYVHPNYDMSTNVNDVAVLRFSALTISSDSTIKFVCLPAANTDPSPIGSNVIAAGWGKTSQSSANISDYLGQVTIQILSPTTNDCKQAPIKNSTVQICAGVIGGGKDTCNGDSGGPLMSYLNNSWVLAGLTSAGHGCAQPGYPGIYTRVSSVISFIENTMESQIPSKNNARNPTDLTYKSILIFLFLLFNMMII